jgi:hypothetical protein
MEPLNNLNTKLKLHIGDKETNNLSVVIRFILSLLTVGASLLDAREGFSI